MLNLIRSQSAQQLSSTIELYQHFHKHPELSFNEISTAQRVEQELLSIGVECYTKIGTTGVIGVINGKHPGPVIGIRAELDALPISEESGVAYSSQTPGVMHACGHDMHMATLVAAARILMQHKESIKGKVLLIFQPGEELLPGGALSIIESNVFKTNFPDLMIGLHVLPEMESGRVGFRAGSYMASGDEVYITVKGKGGHAALPHNLIDPVLISSHVIVALQQLVSRNCPTGIPSVLSFGKLIANGANNIIPDDAAMEGTFRTMDENWRAKAHELIEGIAKGVSSSMGAKCEVEVRKGYPALHNHPQYTGLAMSLAKDYLGSQFVEELPLRMTTDDFGRYAQVTPSVFFRVGCGFPNTQAYSLHSSKFKVNEHVFEHSGGLLAWLVLNMLGSISPRG